MFFNRHYLRLPTLQRAMNDINQSNLPSSQKKMSPELSKGKLRFRSPIKWT